MLKKGWVPFVVLLAALGLAGLSCGKSDSEKSSQAPSPPAETAKPEAPAPGMPGAQGPGAPGPSATGPAPGASGPMAPSAAMPKEATGEVVSANAKAKTLVVKANGSEMRFDVKESAAGDLATIKRGDRVTVQYTEDGGKNTAESIKKG